MLGALVCLTIQLGLALIFGYSGLTKLRDLGAFHQALSRYPFLSLRPSLVGLLAYFVPIAEVLGSVLLLVLPKVGASFLLALILVFSGAIAIGLRQGGGFDCGCLVGVNVPVNPWLLVRNGLLAVSLLLIIFFHASVLPLLHNFDVLGLFTMVVGGLFLLLLYLIADHLLANLSWVGRGRLKEEEAWRF